MAQSLTADAKARVCCAIQDALVPAGFPNDRTPAPPAIDLESLMCHCICCIAEWIKHGTGQSFTFDLAAAHHALFLDTFQVDLTAKGFTATTNTAANTVTITKQ
jgi:hypothetical protein